ncbi:hypothetical protein JTE90_023340 [Oedothorax gibbosus]|uniref:Uncharacterized protein n=1 Tax=Oedothorax gibbosus TaxID=931172 RepID=A0AAV6VED1_9ARAC|nr:hypothetical protein JTE90_023340 [Oedothorax gibbosus]
MAKNRGSKEGFDPALSMPAEQKSSESNKQKIGRIHELFSMITKDTIAKILQYYDEDEFQALNAITSDGGKEALSNWSESGSLKTRNNKNKKKKKKGKKDAALATSNTASFDADDSSSIHSGCNIEIEAEKSSQTTENGNGILPEVADTTESLDNILPLDEQPINNEETKPSITEPEIPPHRLASSVTVSEETVHRASIPSDFNRNSVESESRVSPLSDNSEKQAEQGIKKDKYRSINEGHNRHSPRQRTSSFRRNKSSSISEDSSSQTNPQAPNAAPTKRGFEKCKKDLQRQSASLQRINAQLEKGFEESEKRLKNAFADILTKVENRQKELEQELTHRKIEAFDLLKSRQELCTEYRKRTDRTSTLSEAEWAELRSDIKQFVTERKYDDDLGKTIWFQWPDISEALQTFGEVCPVKNVYSQRPHSGNENAATSNNPEPSPSSSLANEEIESSADRNDVANIADAVEDESHSAGKEATPAFTKNHPPPQQHHHQQGGLPQTENRPTRIYQNKNFSQNRFHQNNRGGFPNNSNNNQRFFRGRGGGNFQRPYPRNNYNNPYQGRQTYDDREHRDNTRDFNANQPRGNRSRGGGGGRYNNNYRNYDKFQRGGGNGPRHVNAEHSSNPPAAAANLNAEKPVNGFDGGNN